MVREARQRAGPEPPAGTHPAVQPGAIPAILSGTDLVAEAQTGMLVLIVDEAKLAGATKVSIATRQNQS